MELSNEFTVDVPVDEAWNILTDLERVAPCMPGAALDKVEDGDYHGVVRVKVGPITAQYRGKATFLERDPQAHRAVVRAEGREVRGQGNASATITATLTQVGTATQVSVATELAITGRVAQFGRSVLAEVSNKLLEQFVEELEVTVLGAAAEAPTAPPAAPDSTASATILRQDGKERSPLENPPPAGDGTPVNLLRLVGPVLARRAMAPAVGLIALVLLTVRIRRRRRGA